MIPATGWKNRAGRLEATASVRVIPITIFVLNLQGDVIAIVDSNGAVAVEYEYDAWGKEIGVSTAGNVENPLHTYNALKYRGYYYDSETG